MLINTQTKNELEVIAFVPATQARKVEKGMLMRVTPTFIKPQEYGYLKATVVWVSNYPASSKSMINVLQNDELVKKTLEGGVQVEVVAELFPNRNTISGFSWTSTEGAPIKINSGSLCEAEINVKEKRPIELLLPKVKEWVGL